MNEIILNSVTTILSVIIGGLIAIFTGDLVNRKMLKKEHTLDLLKKVKELLDEWSRDILLGGIEFIECSSIDKYKGRQTCLSLRSLISIFEINSNILKFFRKEFSEIRKLELLLQMRTDEDKKTLIALSEQHNIKDTLLMFEIEDVNEILDGQGTLILEIHQKIWELIARIDKHIAEKIL